MTKRLFDVCLSLFVLLLLSVPILCLSLLVLIAIGRPVYFKQTRAGFAGRPFEIIKFRTMSEAKGRLYMNAVGRFLRNTSMDEIPQLWNVLRGEMSLVGPRPLLSEDLPDDVDDIALRQQVLPGLTGLAQINGRNKLNAEEKFRFDKYYVEHQSWLLDIKVLLLTPLRFVQWENPARHHSRLPADRAKAEATAIVIQVGNQRKN